MAGIIDIPGKIIIAVFIIGVILFAGILAVFGIAFIHAKDESMMADYSYDLSISTSGPLYNATLLIPLPCNYENESKNCRTFLNLTEASVKNFDPENTLVRIETENCYAILNISAKNLYPLYRNRIMPVAILPGQNESELPPTPTTVYSYSYSPETPELVAMEVDRYFTKNEGGIDTKNPFEKEQLMRPFTILSMTGKDNGFFSKDFFHGKISDDYSESQIEVPVYLSYEAEPGNSLTISCSVRGANEWWAGGWSSNRYEQRVENEFRGSCNGTYMLKGILVAGEGVY